MLKIRLYYSCKTTKDKNMKKLYPKALMTGRKLC